MPALNITVSLSEVLEVRDGPLSDLEIYSCLCRGAETLQDHFITGEASNEFGPDFVINPDTLQLTMDGQVEFGRASKTKQYANYMAPEIEEGFVMTQTAIEQIYVFALGKSLIYSSEYGLKPEEHVSSNSKHQQMSKPIRISDSLESLLRKMTNRNSSQRIPLVKVMEACALQNKKHQRGHRSFSETVRDLYNSLLGSAAQETPQYNPQYSELHADIDRSRRKRRSDRRDRKNSSQYMYRSRSRSRSDSRSHSRQGEDRDTDSLDSRHHRSTPVLDGAVSRAKGNKHDPMTPDRKKKSARNNHLADITNKNGHTSQKKHTSSHSRPSNLNNPANSHRAIENPAFRKYLKLKERQRKLRALHMQLTDEDASSELSDIVVDHMSDSRSQISVASLIAGMYRPDKHAIYGSSSALRLGYDSDRDSIISSEASMVGQDHNMLSCRAGPDGSDAYIAWLKQLTSGQPQEQVPTTHQQKQQAAEPPSNNPNIHTKSKQHKKAPSPKPHKKEFYGPEFVYRYTKPIQRIPIALQGDSRKNPGHLCRVVVVLLTGQKLEVMVDPSTIGHQLYEAVTTHIFLPEFYYFGLTYINDNEHFFIMNDTKLHKVAPDNWKDSWKLQVPPITFTVYLRVKFYIENLAVLKHEITRHQFYLQLRRDILEERCYCNEETALTLAGLAMQVEYGTYDKATMGRNYFVPEHYFSGRTLKRVGSRYVVDHAPEAHAECAQLSEVDAEIEFIRLVQELLPEYGIHYHKLLKNKEDTSNVVWVGINLDQLTLAETVNEQRVTSHEYPWPAIQKISFNRRRFSVKPRPEFGQLKPVKMNFYTNTYKKGQYLLKFCTAQHSFQLKMKTRTTPNQPDFGSGDQVSIGNTEDMDSGNSEDDQTITGDHASQHDVSEVDMESAGFVSTDHIPHKQVPGYRLPPPYRPNTSVSMIELAMVMRETSSKPVQHVARSATTGDVDVVGMGDNTAEDLPSVQSIPEYAASQAYVIDISSHPNQTLSHQTGNETISNTLDTQFRDELLSPEQSMCERDVFEVELEKTDSHGIGITIVGGVCPGKHDYGIFVKSVLLDGPAFKDGQIQPGDRILSIEGENLQGMPHHDAVNLIKKAKQSVKLLISQVKPPGSIKKPDIRNPQSTKRQSISDKSDAHSDTLDDNNDNNLYKREDSPSLTSVKSGLDASVHSPNSVQHSVNKMEETPKNTPKKIAADSCIPVCADIDVNSYDSKVAGVYKEADEDVEVIEEEVVCEEVADKQNINPNYLKLDARKTTYDSDTDSDFDTVVNQVLENTYEPSTVPVQHNLQHTDNRNHSGIISPFETEEFEVFLDRQQGGFGLNVTGGVNTTVRDKGIYVKSVIPNSAAYTDGNIQKGDRILEVDGQSLSGYTHKQAVQTLRDAPPFCKLKLQRRIQPNAVSDNSPSPEPVHEPIQQETRQDRAERKLSRPEEDVDNTYKAFVTDDNTYNVALKKGSYGLGFSILASHGYQGENVIRIKRVFPIGPAADSCIKPGDVILAVNGTSVRESSHTEAMSVLRGAGKLVNLQMCHPDPDGLPPLHQLESQESLELTPTSSTSHASVSEDSDSDYEDDHHSGPAITPPAGFAPSPYPQDQHGLILPKVASPPPPLPVSPPPTLLRREESDSSSEVPGVEVGVAELMDSCRSEMVFIHNVKQHSSQPFNSSLIVREDSALTVESGEATPVPTESRDNTPCVNVDGEATPVNVIDDESTANISENFEVDSDVYSKNDSCGIESPRSVSEALSTGDSINASVLVQSQDDDVSESDAESASSHSQTNTTTSFIDSRPIDEQLVIDNSIVSLESTPLEVLQVEQSDLGVTEDKDRLDTADVSDTVVSATSDDCVYIADHVYNSNDQGSSGETDDDDDEDELSDNLRRLEEKYIEQEEKENSEEEEEEEHLVESHQEDDLSQSDETQEKESLSHCLEIRPLQPGELEVTLMKPEGKGLGFTVAGGASTTGGCYVKAVLQDPALSDGRLRSGDKLIMVNNVDMRSLSHFDAVTVLCEASGAVTLRVYRASLDTEADVTVYQGQEGLTEQPQQMLDKGTFEVPRGSSVLDEIESESDSEEWTADVEQSSHDAHSLSTQYPVQDLIQSLEQSRQQETLPRDNSKKVENYWRDKSHKEADVLLNMSPKSPEPSVYQFDLHKSESSGLGISLVTAETQHQTGVFIKTIMPGGVADEDGRLQVGDKILQINGESLVGLNHNKAAAILRNSHGKLSLTVSRNKKRNPFWVEESGEEVFEKDTEAVREEEEACVEDEAADISSSLSLTQYVPDDVDEDDHVEDLVAEAVRVLNETNLELSKDDTIVSSGSDSDDTSDIASHHQRAEDEHKYLSASEIIDYVPDEINAEGAVVKADEQVYSNAEESDNDTDAFIDDITGADSSNCDTGAIDDGDNRCWCDSLRKLDITLPDEVTSEWLSELKVATIPEELRQNIPDIIADMQEKIDINDPQGEFKQLRRLTLTDQCLAAHEPHNKPKNRFRNVLPYDYNRLKLSEDPDTDYINASRIRYHVANSICDYIACQGPLPDTTDHFWTMVWQQDVMVIVMLTLDMEAMKVKCHRYWPESVETPVEVCNGKYRLSLLYLNSLDNFDIRNILMEDLESGESRSVYHLNYTTWPDHGTPQSAMPLLQCMRLSHQLHEKGPMVIHCSAGIGRSGTFITIDVALAHIEAALQFDIFEIVKELRRQRQGMIQTRDQYVFCYSACVEALADVSCT